MSLSSLLCILVVCSVASGELVNIEESNLDSVLNGHELVFVNFYADWCRFSRMLAPIFQQASDEVQKVFPDAGLVTLGKVDCEKNPSVAQRYSVNKYPTMKLFRGGQMTKREFRGQRSVEAIVEFIREQLKDPVTIFETEDQMDDLEVKKRSIVGYFNDQESPEYKNFIKLSKSLKDDCDFYAGFGEISKKERLSGDNIVFKPTGGDPDMVYLGSLNNFDLLKAWSTDKCIPLVREITFQNGEELTEEGLPFLILFHKKEDTESLELYQNQISRHLLHEKSKINFLEADCDTFSHPLHHLGKTPKDCPLIAIDSFKHMYLFKDFNQLTVPGALKAFLEDLHSGKLHREFHHGPDPVTPEIAQKQEDKQPPSGYHAGAPSEQPKPPKIEPPKMTPEVKEHLRKMGKDPEQIEKQMAEEMRKRQQQQGNMDTVQPPIDTTIESVFKNLMPSEHRYTIIDRMRDEL